MRTGLQFSAAMAALALLCPPAHAAERITLSNGFSVDCSRHETVNGQVRLYTSGNSYMDVAAERIAKIETVAEVTNVSTSQIPTAFDKNTVKDIPTAYAKDSVQPIPNASLADRELSAEELRPLLLHAGAQHRIDEDLLASVVKAESAGHTAAVSRTGAQGLMQLMPGTAAELGVQNAFQPQQNIDGGAAYLDQLLVRYHDNVQLALAAYNAGPQAVDRYHGIPPFAETRAYVRRVILEFNRRKRAQAQPSIASLIQAPATVQTASK